ncbi:hypothetical protein HK098_004756 [Nowakowskiella sp. JEL0407]|nr:hypothetical protein HK098_004756 [Nowakowskiella sp. JEL0407]
MPADTLDFATNFPVNLASSAPIDPSRLSTDEICTILSRNDIDLPSDPQPREFYINLYKSTILLETQLHPVKIRHAPSSIPEKALPTVPQNQSPLRAHHYSNEEILSKAAQVSKNTISRKKSDSRKLRAFESVRRQLIPRVTSTPVSDSESENEGDSNKSSSYYSQITGGMVGAKQAEQEKHRKKSNKQTTIRKAFSESETVNSVPSNNQPADSPRRFFHLPGLASNNIPSSTSQEKVVETSAKPSTPAVSSSQTVGSDDNNISYTIVFDSLYDDSQNRESVASSYVSELITVQEYHGEEDLGGQKNDVWKAPSLITPKSSNLTSSAPVQSFGETPEPDTYSLEEPTDPSRNLDEPKKKTASTRFNLILKIFVVLAIISSCIYGIAYFAPVQLQKTHDDFLLVLKDVLPAEKIYCESEQYSYSYSNFFKSFTTRNSQSSSASPEESNWSVNRIFGLVENVGIYVQKVGVNVVRDVESNLMTVSKYISKSIRTWAKYEQDLDEVATISATQHQNCIECPENSICRNGQLVGCANNKPETRNIRLLYPWIVRVASKVTGKVENEVVNDLRKYSLSYFASPSCVLPNPKILEKCERKRNQTKYVEVDVEITTTRYEYVPGTTETVEIVGRQVVKATETAKPNAENNILYEDCMRAGDWEFGIISFEDFYLEVERRVIGMNRQFYGVFLPSVVDAATEYLNAAVEYSGNGWNNFVLWAKALELAHIAVIISGLVISAAAIAYLVYKWRAKSSEIKVSGRKSEKNAAKSRKAINDIIFNLRHSDTSYLKITPKVKTFPRLRPLEVEARVEKIEEMKEFLDSEVNGRESEDIEVIDLTKD